MSFDKTKAIRAAEKHLASGKLPAAIEEYRNIIKHDANDYTVLNMLGDLYARTKKNQEAIGCFTSIAEHYRTQGFALKAIAMYKKMLRMQPDSVEVAGHLAALYEQQGLVVDARAQYLAVADALTKQGRTRDTLDVLRRIADLDPHNADVRLKLADSYQREDFLPEAATAFTDAGEQLLSRRAHDRALDAFNRALEIRPGDKFALGGLVSAHTGRGTPGEVVGMLEQAVAEQPADVELLSMLQRAYTETGDAAAAEQTTEEIIKYEPTSYRGFVDVALVYLKGNKLEDAVRVITRVVEPMLSKGEEAELLALLQEILSRAPAQLTALQTLARVYTWQRDEVNLRQTYEQIAEAAEAAGEDEQARHALVQLVRLSPEQTLYQQRLIALGGMSGDGGDSSESNGLEDHSLASELSVASQLPSASQEVPTFESFMFEDNAATPAAAVVASASSTESAASPPAADTLVEEAAFEWNTTAETTSSAASTAPPLDASASFADLNDSAVESSDDLTAVSLDSSAAETGSFQEFEFNTVVANPVQVGTTDEGLGERAGSGTQQLEAALNQELESVDFYLAQGYTDIAGDTLDMLERQYGQHPNIDARRNLLKQGATAPTTTADAASSPLVAEPFTDTTNAAAAAATTSSPEPTTNSFDFTFDDAASSSSREVPGAVGKEVNRAVDQDVNQAFISLDPVTAAPIGDVVDDEVDSAFFDLEGASVGEAAAVVPLPEAMEMSVDPGLASIFEEFRSAVEEDSPEQQPPPDYETHYNLGLAYKEMELLDEAIEEFQTAASVAGPQDGTPRYLQCCNLLGHCFMRKAMPQVAAMWFKKGLDAPGHSEDEYQALRYELGTAYEGMGELDRAINTFSEVYGISVSYRGVSEKLRDLQAQRAVK